MSLPITVIPETVEGRSGQDVGGWVKRVKRTQQTKPYNLVLPYEVCWRRCDAITQKDYPQAFNAEMFYPVSPEGHHALSFGPYNAATTLHQDSMESAANKALAHFQAKLSDTASLGLTLVQHRQAMDMLTNRLQALGKFARNLKRGNFRSAWESLDVSPKDLKRLKSKEDKLKATANKFGSNFLEVHFGWVPLVQDVYNSMEVLSSPIPYGKVTASGKVILVKESGPVSFLNFWETLTSEHSGTYRCRIGAEIAVTNPNLNLLNSLGLLNPAEVLWDAIPWSFVVGWFVDVSEFLRNFNRFAGMTLTNAYHNYSLDTTCTNTRRNRYPGYQGSSHVVTSARSFKRASGTPIGSIVVKGIKLPSALRGLTAASLLAQFLRPSRP